MTWDASLNLVLAVIEMVSPCAAEVQMHPRLSENARGRPLWIIFNQTTTKFCLTVCFRTTFRPSSGQVLNPLQKKLVSYK